MKKTRSTIRHIGKILDVWSKAATFIVGIQEPINIPEIRGRDAPLTQRAEQIGPTDRPPRQKLIIPDEVRGEGGKL